MNNRIGYACTPIWLPYKTSRSFIVKNFSYEKFNECVDANLADLMRILQWNVDNNIFMFRISSDIIPFGGHEVNKLAWWEIFSKELKELGDYIVKNGIRVSMHPGQYTVLNSPTEEIVKRSIEELDYHCRFLDALGVDSTNKLILHVGGVYGDKKSAMDRFVLNSGRLSNKVKARLVIENDDKCYTVQEVLELSNRTEFPVVFDNLHHKLNPCDMKMEDILTEVRKTWKALDGAVKFHYSEQDNIKKGGAHSKTINTDAFLEYWEIISKFPSDVMLEVKDKELSAIKCTYLTASNLKASDRTREWAKYKYAVMERDYNDYKICSKLISTDANIREFYRKIDDCLDKAFDEGNYINAALHVYGYVKNKVTDREKAEFHLSLQSPEENRAKIKKMLEKFCGKYGDDYINESYYFVY